MSLNVKTGDTVVVIAGKDKGSKGKVIAAYPAAGRVKVENVNVITKHKKPRSAQVPGGIFKEPAAIDVSNVQIICPSCDKATRVRHAETDGKKARVCCKCGATLDVAVKLDKKKKKDAAKPVKAKAEKPKAEKKTAKEEETAETTEKKTVKKTAKKETETAEPAKKAAKKPAAKTEPAPVTDTEEPKA